MNSDSPNVVAIPPLVFLAGFLAGLFLQWFAPLNFFPGVAPKIIGFVVAVTSGILAISGFIAMHRAGTNIDVRRPALAIVSTGPFRFTRNPLYLSLVLISLGVALFFNLAWVAILLVPIVFMVHYGIIKREERYLESKFGQQYLEYKNRVRRWV
jgi:protein-S-isoprenylcysteine O-methyltransferase Ste14